MTKPYTTRLSALAQAVQTGRKLFNSEGVNLSIIGASFAYSVIYSYIIFRPFK